MKKLIAIVLAIVMIIATCAILNGCGGRKLKTKTVESYGDNGEYNKTLYAEINGEWVKIDHVISVRK